MPKAKFSRAAIAATFALLVSSISAFADDLQNAPERVKPEPISENTFGIALSDPYRWMEQPARAADFRAWLSAAGAHTVDQLGRLPGRSSLVAAIHRADEAGVRYANPQLAGTLVFAMRNDVGAPQAKLIVRQTNGNERVLLDPETLGKGTSINGFTVSPDAKTVAINISKTGAELGDIRFLDVASGHFRPGDISPVWGEFHANWMDPATVTITRIDASQIAKDPLHGMTTFVYHVGDSQPKAAALGAGVDGPAAIDAGVFPLIDSSKMSQWSIGIGANARSDALVFVAPTASIAAGHPQWQKIADWNDRVNGAAAFGDGLYVITTHESSNGQLQRVPLQESASLARAAVITQPDRDLILSDIAAAKEGVYVSGKKDGLAHLYFLPDGTGTLREIALPFNATLGHLRSSTDGRGVSFTLEGNFVPVSAFAAEHGRLRSLGIKTARYAGVTNFEERRFDATSRDGTKVPMLALLPRHLPDRPDAPTLLEGYGSYGISMVEPYYSPRLFALLEAGGIYVACGTRGGGERGRQWHDDGREANKPKAQDDFIACGEKLVELGLTSPAKLTAWGTSAGGLLVGPAVLKRPDLFRSAILNVSILNSTRLEVAPNGANQYAEMGDPRTQDGFKALLAQDSYQMLPDAKDMPDTLVMVGLNDNRVAPWMGAKFAARALDRFGERHLVLIRADSAAGHGIGSDEEVKVQSAADVITFTLNRAGAPGFVSPAHAQGSD